MAARDLRSYFTSVSIDKKASRGSLCAVLQGIPLKHESKFNGIFEKYQSGLF